MLESSLARIEERLLDTDRVLDIGGWAKPLLRADWVLDLMPYETRGEYGSLGSGTERFRAERWVQRDICDREPFPFEDGEIDFAVCSHTLEDVRDPVWVCSEINRIARAGYIETPSRLEEQAWGVNGDWVGWSHHRWLIQEVDGDLEFMAKPHMLHGRGGPALAPGGLEGVPAVDRVVAFFWEGGFGFRERFIFDVAELHRYLAQPLPGRRRGRG